MTAIQFARQTALASGMAGALFVALAAGPAVAGHGYMMKQQPLRATSSTVPSQPAEPVEVRRLVGVELTAALRAPGVAKLRLDEMTVQPGAAVDASAFATAFMCEVVQGELEAVVDGAPVKRIDGDVWPCAVEPASGAHTNTGTTQAVMRVFHLLR